MSSDNGEHGVSLSELLESGLSAEDLGAAAASVVRSNVASCTQTSVPHASCRTSNSWIATPSAVAARNAASVFSGWRALSPRCDATSGRGAGWSRSARKTGWACGGKRGRGGKGRRRARAVAMIPAMSPDVYRLLHVVGVLLLFVGLGGVFAAGGKGNEKPSGLFLALHGVGLLVMLVAGIGTVHKDPAVDWGNWLYAKIGCWVLLAAMPILVRKGVLPRFAGLLLALALGAAAVWLAQQKPF